MSRSAELEEADRELQQLSAHPPSDAADSTSTAARAGAAADPAVAERLAAVVSRLDEVEAEAERLKIRIRDLEEELEMERIRCAIPLCLTYPRTIEASLPFWM